MNRQPDAGAGGSDLTVGMDLSAFGRRLLGDSGTWSLMDDLGGIAASGGSIMNLGGGNPSLVPAAVARFRLAAHAGTAATHEPAARTRAPEGVT